MPEKDKSSFIFCTFVLIFVYPSWKNATSLIQQTYKTDFSFIKKQRCQQYYKIYIPWHLDFLIALICASLCLESKPKHTEVLTLLMHRYNCCIKMLHHDL